MPVESTKSTEKRVKNTRNNNFAKFYQKGSRGDPFFDGGVWYGDGAGEPNGAWPGKACTDLGNGLCKFTFDTTIGQPSEWGIIFNYGALQTDDFVAENRKIYNMSGIKGEVEVEEDNKETVSVEDVEDTDIIEVYSIDRVIFVNNTNGKQITVRSIDGRVVYSGNDIIIPMANVGIYIVSVEGQTVKIYVQ